MIQLHMVSDLVMDVGAHNGNDTAYYLSKGFQVVAVEANPNLCAQLRTRFANDLRNGRLRLVDAAISDQIGEADFWINDTQTEWSSIVQDMGVRGGSAHRIGVSTITMEHLFQNFGVPYYLKVDIERADVHCLRSLNKKDLPTYVSVEAHELEYLFLLRSAGYNAFKCIDQMAHNDMRKPFFPRLQRTWGKVERRIVKQPFPIGSSGPMPNETVGPWQTLEQVSYEWLHHHFGFQRRTHLYCRSWLDFHAAVIPSPLQT
jgi:FkbM family methyltransferase